MYFSIQTWDRNNPFFQDMVLQCVALDELSIHFQIVYVQIKTNHFLKLPMPKFSKL